jgi:hypothetical protein
MGVRFLSFVLLFERFEPGVKLKDGQTVGIRTTTLRERYQQLTKAFFHLRQDVRTAIPKTSGFLLSDENSKGIIKGFGRLFSRIKEMGYFGQQVFP